jgi:O-succinylbenzoate synthase
VEITPEIKEQVLATAKVLSVPMRIKFRGVSTREVVIFEGPYGWAEWSPFPEYPDEEAAIWLKAALEFAYTDFQPKARTVKVNATLPAVDNVKEALEPFGKFEVVKIKVAEKGQSLEDDIRRLNTVLELYPDTRVRLDANGAFKIETALKLSEYLLKNKINLEYLEQPVKTIAEMAELKLKLKSIGDIKIAADESVRKVSDPLAVAQANAADILVLKAAPLGGITNAIAIAKEAGLPVVVSSALETSIGLSMGAFLAAELNSPYASGLGTAALLAEDVTEHPLLPINGEIPVTKIKINETKLEQQRATSETTERQMDRLERCLKVPNMLN